MRRFECGSKLAMTPKEFSRVYRSRQVANGEMDWVFQGVKPGLRFTAIDHRLRTVFEWAGVYEKGRLAHTFRHAVMTRLLENGVDLETVRDSARASTGDDNSALSACDG